MKNVSGGLLKYLTDGDLKKIHLATMRVMRDVGILVENEEARQALDQIGCRVDPKTCKVFFPGYIIEEAIHTAPKTFTLYAKKSEYNMILDNKRVYFGPGGLCLNVVDIDTGNVRRSVLNDLVDLAKLINKLDNVNFYTTALWANDIADEDADLEMAKAGFDYCDKHITTAGLMFKGTKEVLDYAAKIVGGYDQLERTPIVSFICDTVSPFILEKINTKNNMECARRGVPVIVGSECMAGGTSPVTMAGTLVQINSEVLAALCVNQAAKKGAPFMYGTVSSVMDLRTGHYTAGALETGILTAGVAQIGQYYGIPVYGTAGMSDSKTPDVQSGFERALTLLTGALAGANYIHDAIGMLEFAMTFSFSQAVIDNEIIGMVKRIMQGIEINDNTLAVELMSRIGSGGHYLAEEHTLHYMKKEHFFPIIADRRSREKWESEGSKDANERALEKVRSILRTY